MKLSEQARSLFSILTFFFGFPARMVLYVFGLKKGMSVAISGICRAFGR
jgi:hypothetical protein